MINKKKPSGFNLPGKPNNSHSTKVAFLTFMLVEKLSRFDRLEQNSKAISSHQDAKNFLILKSIFVSLAVKEIGHRQILPIHHRRRFSSIRAGATMAGQYSEEELEDTVLVWLEELGYNIASGPQLSPGGSHPERDSTDEVILWNRLERQLAFINPRAELPAIEEALRKVRAFSLPSLIQTNRDLHRWLTDGVDVQFRSKSGDIKSDNIQLVDFNNNENNDLLAVNQLTVTNNRNNRRPDVVL